MVSPFLILGVILLVAVVLIGASGVLLLSSYRDHHPSIEIRRKELSRAIMADEITEDEYADKVIALDYEETRARINRRVK